VSSLSSNRTILITGATSGIGKQTARVLASTGAHLILCGRSEEKLAALTAELSSQTELTTLCADLANQAEVHQLADAVVDRFERLDVLINNAGALFTTRQITTDGFEHTWALNHLGYFLLTARLRTLLIQTPESRIINVASDAHRQGRMNWDDLQYADSWPTGGWAAYCQSKLANILFTRELARQLASCDVSVHCLHPGFVNTGFAKNNGSLARLAMALTRPFQRTVTKGADTVIWLATVPQTLTPQGQYFVDQRAAQPTHHGTNDADAKRLWDLSLEMTQAHDFWTPKA